MHGKHEHLLDAGMAGAGALLRVKTGESVFHQTVARQEERCEGITDPEELIKLVHGRTIHRIGMETIKGSLTGIITEVDIDIIGQLRDEVALASRHKEQCQVPQRSYQTSICGNRSTPFARNRNLLEAFATKNVFAFFL